MQNYESHENKVCFQQSIREINGVFLFASTSDDYNSNKVKSSKKRNKLERCTDNNSDSEKKRFRHRLFNSDNSDHGIQTNKSNNDQSKSKTKKANYDRNMELNLSQAKEKKVSINKISSNNSELSTDSSDENSVLLEYDNEYMSNEYIPLDESIEKEDIIHTSDDDRQIFRKIPKDMANSYQLSGDNTSSSTYQEIPTFRKLGLSPSLSNTLSKFAIVVPTPVQITAIPAALQGKNIFIQSPTGSGKTLCFLTPILQGLSKDPYGVYALIISPIRELALQIQEQVVAISSACCVSSVCVTGGQDFASQAAILSSRPHIVVSTPGRLASTMKSTSQENLSIFKRIAVFVADEADLLLNGEKFRDIQTILDFIHFDGKATELNCIANKNDFLNNNESDTLLESPESNSSDSDSDYSGDDTLDDSDFSHTVELDKKKVEKISEETNSSSEVSSDNDLPGKKTIIEINSKRPNKKITKKLAEYRQKAELSLCKKNVLYKENIQVMLCSATISYSSDVYEAAFRCTNLITARPQEFLSSSLNSIKESGVALPNGLLQFYVSLGKDEFYRMAYAYVTISQFMKGMKDKIALSTLSELFDDNEFELDSELEDKQAVIFCNTTDRATIVALTLRNLGLSTVYLSGRQKQSRRVASLNAFRSGRAKVLVATDVASRGLDIPSVGLVLNYDCPSSSTTYVHRAGRTARRGQSGEVVTFISPVCRHLLEKIELDTDSVMNVHEFTGEIRSTSQGNNRWLVGHDRRRIVLKELIRVSEQMNRAEVLAEEYARYDAIASAKDSRKEFDILGELVVSNDALINLISEVKSQHKSNREKNQ